MGCRVALVLATGAPTASGHDYADVPGVRHAFPRRYRRQMQSGTPFLYYRGRRAASLGLPGKVYFGSAVLGAAPDTGEEELFAEVLDFVEFDEPVPIRRPDGEYFETAAAGNSSYWRRGVRTVDDVVVASILAQAGVLAVHAVEEPLPGEMVAKPKPHGESQADYAKSKALIDAVERYSVDVVLTLLAEEYGREVVQEMPHGNPGYDVLVTRHGPDLHVEVKGTRQRDPVFFMSEGERLHSQRQAPNYRLCVVSRIDLDKGSHRVHWHEGAVGTPHVELKPRQWEAELVLPE